MTCIVGLVDGGKVYLGGDSAGVDGLHLAVRKDPKVFRVGECIIGFTSSFRMGQLLAHSLKPPKWHGDKDVFEYMVTDFVDAVRECLKAGGYARRNCEAEEGGTFLVGFHGRLFEIEEDYQVGETLAGVAACGCGRDVALGSLFSTTKMPAIERVRLALQAAEAFNAEVRGPFNTQVL